MPCPPHQARQSHLARQPHPARQPRGFTLIELLVALATMSLLALLGWRALDGLLRTREIIHARDVQQTTLQTVLAQWQADLEAVMALEHTQAVLWDGQVLRLTRRAARGGVMVVAWARRAADGQWLRWQSAPLGTRAEWSHAWGQAAQWGRNPPSALRQQETALLPLVGWRLYYWRDNAWSNPLSSGQSEDEADPEGGDTPAGDAPTGDAPAGNAPARPRRTLPDVPQGIRLEITLPADAAIPGRLRVDWISPLHSVRRS